MSKKSIVRVFSAAGLLVGFYLIYVAATALDRSLHIPLVCTIGSVLAIGGVVGLLVEVEE